MEYNNILRESWASYVGWELCNAYYVSRGLPLPHQENDITKNACQDWKKTGEDYVYSPLFVDLRDTYNQRGGHYGWSCNNDTVANIDYNCINRIAREAENLNDVEAILGEYFNPGRPYLGVVVAREYLAPYREWQTNNPTVL